AFARVLGLLERDHVVAALAILHQAGVGRDPVQPGGEGGLGLEVPEPAIGREESVLQRLGGVVLVAQDLEREPVDLVPVAAHQLRERRALSVRGGGDRGGRGRAGVVGLRARPAAGSSPRPATPASLARYTTSPASTVAKGRASARRSGAIWRRSRSHTTRSA